MARLFNRLTAKSHKYTIEVIIHHLTLSVPEPVALEIIWQRSTS